MNCYMCDFNKDDSLDDFIKNNAINQQDYKLKEIYSDNCKFQYEYIICKENDKILGIMPFVLYNNINGNVIHSMPFVGYGGIASLNENKDEIYSSIINYLNEVAVKNNVLLITICTKPFDSDYNLYKKYFKPDYERKNFYQYMLLDGDIEANMKGKFRRNLKRNIKKCKECGVILEESKDLNDLKLWYNDVYCKRLTETNCAIYPYTVFETMILKLDDARVKMVYTKLDGKIIGGGLFLNQGISFDNFMRVVDSEYFYTQAGNLIDEWSIEYAQNAGLKYYNWQSCDEIGSTIYKYKEDWGSKLDYHYYLTKIVGDVSSFKKTQLKTIKEEYKGIYVMPYEEFEN